jgi:benzoylformate decarboxylase
MTVPPADIPRQERSQTVRDRVLELLRELGVTTMFSNPGSTEISFLTELPSDLTFVLCLHEGSVVGAATGWALATGRAALVVLHSLAGLGNAVGALATARVNRVPLVVIVGEQDRRHLAAEPFVSGRLDGLAGEYPVTAEQPAIAEDVPAAIVRAYHAAHTSRGPALVFVPMDDWHAKIDEIGDFLAATEVLRPPAADAGSVGRLAEMLDAAREPALVVGAGAGDERSWTALVALADRLLCPVFQEPFGAEAGFPQDHPQFAGHLPGDRAGLRGALAPYDVVLVVGGPVFRQYPFGTGRFVRAGTRVAMITTSPSEAHRSPAELAVIGSPAAICEALARSVAPRIASTPPTPRSVAAWPRRSEDRLRPEDVFTALAERAPADTIVVEETPSSRPALHALLPARAPLGFVSAGMGGLGFALPAAIGLRMGAPGRPVVAVLGDGSALYQPQALWTAVHYRVGALFVILVNHRYAIMDRLAQLAGGSGPWPRFDEIDLVALSWAQGCPALPVHTYGQLTAQLDETLPGLRDRDEPLVLAVEVASG